MRVPVAVLALVLGAHSASADTETSTTPWTLEPPTISGFVQVHYRYAFKTGEDAVVDNHNFRVQRVRIKLAGELQSWLIYDISVDPRAPELKGVLRDAWIGLRLLPKHVLRLGQQKTQFGWENRNSSSKLFFVNRTEVSDNLSGGVNQRDIGVGLLGKIKLGNGWRIEDAITWVNGSGLNVQDDQTPMKNLWGRLGVRWKTDLAVTSLGVSGGLGDEIDPGDDPDSTTDDFKRDFKRAGVDLEIDSEWAFLAAELVLGEDTVPGETAGRNGWYVMGVGKTPWAVGPTVRFDALDDDYQRLTFGAYYGLPEDFLRVLINYELRLTKDGSRGDDKLYVWTQVQF